MNEKNDTLSIKKNTKWSEKISKQKNENLNFFKKNNGKKNTFHAWKFGVKALIFTRQEGEQKYHII
jgi:hypothetical protein